MQKPASQVLKSVVWRKKGMTQPQAGVSGGRGDPPQRPSRGSEILPAPPEDTYSRNRLHLRIPLCGNQQSVREMQYLTVDNQALSNHPAIAAILGSS